MFKKKTESIYRSQAILDEDTFGTYSPSTTNGNDTNTNTAVTVEDSDGISSSSSPETPGKSNAASMSRLDTMSLSFALLEGEQIIDRERSVCEWTGRHWAPGVLLLTNFRVVFQPENMSTYDDVPLFEGSKIPLATIHKVEKVGGKMTRGDHNYLMEIHAKDMRMARFSFLPSLGTRGKIVKFIKREYPQEALFCFDHKTRGHSVVDFGWNLYSPFMEYKRQGVDVAGGRNSNGWRICEANHNFKISDTYPQQFVIPASLTDEDIKAVAAFRSKGRIPLLSFYDQETGCVMMRSSQPLMGFGLKGTKRSDDYKMIEAIMKSSGNINENSNNSTPQSPSSRGNGHMDSSNHSKEKLLIMDLRPLLNAEANRLKSGGYEKNYKNTEIKFMGIDNIHVMRRSFLKLTDLCITTAGACEMFMSKVEQTMWLEYSRLLLMASNVCVESIQRDRISILLHCSDGWDRTSQVCALAQIMIDPYYRTFEGFAVLVEKDWLAYGHQFYKRIGHGQRNFSSDERGPIFLQFLDTVYQLMYQNPTAFEYNDQFLMYIMDAVYNCQFGTFLFDCVREREHHRVSERTKSVWTQFVTKGDNAKNTTNFKNPFYDPDQTSQTITVDCRQCMMQFWSSYYLRYSKRMTTQEHSKSPETILVERGFNILEEVHKVEDTYQTEMRKNEATVATFQREFKKLMVEIDQLKQEKQLLQEKYDHDTAALLEMCEKQKEELQRWTLSEGHDEGDDSDDVSGSSTPRNDAVEERVANIEQ